MYSPPGRSESHTEQHFQLTVLHLDRRALNYDSIRLNISLNLSILFDNVDYLHVRERN